MNEPCLGTYRVGDTTKSGESVKLIHGQSVDVFVFEDMNGRINWETRVDPPPLREVGVHNLFNRLHSRASALKNAEQRAILDNELARALFRALCEADEVLALAHFGDVETKMNQEALVRSQIIYAVSGCCMAAAIAAASGLLIVFVTDLSAKQVLVGVGMGVGGAWVSVVQRAWKLTVRPFEAPH